MKFPAVRPVTALVIITAAAAAGALSARRLGAAASPQPAAGMSRPGPASQPGQAAPAKSQKPDPRVEAASAWLRATVILARQPRDYAAELKEQLGNPSDILAAWQKADPEACWAWFRKDGYRMQQVSRGSALLTVIKGHEPEALALLKSLPDRERTDLARQITQAVFLLPPATAAALISQNPTLLSCDGNTTVDQPLTILKAMGSAPSGPEGKSLMAFLTDRSATLDPAATAAWWETQPGSVQASTAAALLLSWKTGPPPWNNELLGSLMGIMLENTTPDEAGSCIANYVKHLSSTDPIAALQWVENTLPVDAFENISDSVAELWTRETLARLAVTASPRMVDEVVESLGDFPEISAKLTRALLAAPAGSAEQQLGLRLLQGLPDDDPQLRQWVEQAPADTLTSQLVLSTTTARLREENPAQVMAWLGTLEGKPVSQAARQTAWEWFEKSPAEAAVAVSNLPPGPIRQAAVMASGGWLTSDFPAATAWLDQLPATDRPAALQAIQTALSPEAQQQILTKWNILLPPPPPPEEPDDE